MKMFDIMLDLETLGTSADCVVCSISAVQFDRYTGEIGAEFEVKLNWQHQQYIGRVIEANTVSWWFSREDSAIKDLVNMPTVALVDGLKEFNQWLRDLYPDGKDGDKPINNINLWGNGVTFDNTIIRSLYKDAKLSFCVPYWCDKDLRTAIAMHPDGELIKVNTPRVGIFHKGLDDCKHQIKILHTIIKHLPSVEYIETIEEV